MRETHFIGRSFFKKKNFSAKITHIKNIKQKEKLGKKKKHDRI